LPSAKASSTAATTTIESVEEVLSVEKVLATTTTEHPGVNGKLEKGI
jgi:hypothetical protein